MGKRWPEKTVIGITGNIATGKSVVRRMLEHLGAFGIDADGLVHRAMSPGAPAYLPVVEMFGKWILTSGGQIDRKRLGMIAFNDRSAMAALEKITHPVVLQVIDILIRRSKQKVVVIEAIKLFESGLAGHCDAVWVVDAPSDIQLQRLVKAKKLSEAEAKLRIAVQPLQEEKRKQATLVIDNGGGYEKTWLAVQQAYNALMGLEQAPEEPEAEPVVARQAAAVEVREEDLSVKRGGPQDARDIAAYMNALDGSSLSRMDILVRFGQKAYMLLYGGDQIVGIAGWQVENLIARVDEFSLLPGVPVNKAVKDLTDTIEKAAFDLQSEIVLVFLSNKVSRDIRHAVLGAGYEIKTVAELRVPDWREAAEESTPPDSLMFYKRIREDRVLEPI
nr:dephospho-CoA kinase [Anaerolineae bacterium]